MFKKNLLTIVILVLLSCTVQAQMMMDLTTQWSTTNPYIESFTCTPVADIPGGTYGNLGPGNPAVTQTTNGIGTASEKLTTIYTDNDVGGLTDDFGSESYCTATVLPGITAAQVMAADAPAGALTSTGDLSAPEPTISGNIIFNGGAFGVVPLPQTIPLLQVSGTINPVDFYPPNSYVGPQMDFETEFSYVGLAGLHLIKHIIHVTYVLQDLPESAAEEHEPVSGRVKINKVFFNEKNLVDLASIRGQTGILEIGLDTTKDLFATSQTVLVNINLILSNGNILEMRERGIAVPGDFTSIQVPITFPSDVVDVVIITEHPTQEDVGDYWHYDEPGPTPKPTPIPEPGPTPPPSIEGEEEIIEAPFTGRKYIISGVNNIPKEIEEYTFNTFPWVDLGQVTVTASDGTSLIVPVLGPSTTFSIKDFPPGKITISNEQGPLFSFNITTKQIADFVAVKVQGQEKQTGSMVLDIFGQVKKPTNVIFNVKDSSGNIVLDSTGNPLQISANVESGKTVTTKFNIEKPGVYTLVAKSTNGLQIPEVTFEIKAKVGALPGEIETALGVEEVKPVKEEAVPIEETATATALLLAVIGLGFGAFNSIPKGTKFDPKLVLEGAKEPIQALVYALLIGGGLIGLIVAPTIGLILAGIGLLGQFAYVFLKLKK